MNRTAAAAVATALAAALAGTLAPAGSPARAQSAGSLALAPRYEVQRVDSPAPENGGQFAGGIVNGGDLDGDGVDDIIAPQVRGPGTVFVVSGATGDILLTLPAPATAGSSAGASAQFGRYVSKVADFASCTGGQPSVTCPQNPIGGPDGVPEIAVGATGVDVGDFIDLGRAWVIDGGTGAILKQLDMPAADVAHQKTVAPRPRPNFGRTVLSPSSPWSDETAVLEGDMDGQNQPDIVVGAFGYHETGPESNPKCDPGPCARSGRAYVFLGEDIAGSDPVPVLDTPVHTIVNPMAESDDPDAQIDTNTELFGHSASPVGDVGKCNIDPGPGAVCRPANSTNAADGRPDVVISAFRVNLVPGMFDVGVAFLIDGATGSVLLRYEHPDPQPASIFGANNYNQPALGDAGDTTSPDVYLPAMRQDGDDHLGEGRGYVMNGDFKVFPDNIAFSRLDDPTPAPGGNFGWSAAGVGDVNGDARNDILVGAGGPLFPGTDQTIINDVHFFDVGRQKVIRTYDDPDQQEGSGFGTGVQPLGDVNGDGLLDWAASASYFDAGGLINVGRLYIFRSTTEPVAVARTVSLRLKGHLRAKGAVAAGEVACIDSVAVVIRRNGKKVETTTTDAAGAYSVRVKDRTGRYRAVAPELLLADAGFRCEKGKSPTKRHRH